MLFEGECEGLGARAAAAKFGFSPQRYFQLRKTFRDKGSRALINQKRGPQAAYRRTARAVREIARLRERHPNASLEVLSGKVRQTGLVISDRSVQRVIAELGIGQRRRAARQSAATPSAQSRPGKPAGPQGY
jgi:transposase